MNALAGAFAGRWICRRGGPGGPGPGGEGAGADPAGAGRRGPRRRHPEVGGGRGAGPAGGGQLVVSDNQLSTSEVQLCSVSTGKVNCKYQSNEGNLI
jgi:hypothetical protein